MRTWAAVLAALVLPVAAGCGGNGTVSPAQVKKAFAREGIDLLREREMEKRFREAARGGRGMVGGLVGQDIPIPDAFYVAQNVTEDVDFYVALFSHTVKVSDFAGGEKQLKAIRRQGLDVLSRKNVVVVVDKTPGDALGRHVRAALRRLR